MQPRRRVDDVDDTGAIAYYADMKVIFKMRSGRQFISAERTSR